MPKKNPDLIVEQWPIGRLTGYLGNPRKNDHVVDRMCQTITEFGFRIPVVATSDGQIVDGHLRHKAALKLGMKTIPVALADGLTANQIKAFRIAANASAAWADWDTDLLRIELTDLKLEGYDLNLTGFDDVQLVQFMAAVPTGADPEAVPEPPTNPVSRKGDLWLLGNHRLLCGDATSAEDVERLLDGAKPHLMVTDQPWGVNYDSTWRDETGLTRSAQKAVGKVVNDHQSDWREVWGLFSGDVIYVWVASLHSHETALSLMASGFDLRASIIWAKQGFVFGRGNYHWQHEPCWYAVRSSKTSHWAGDRKQTTVWNIDNANLMKGGSKDDTLTGHSTQKPIECMKRPIENNSRPGDAVYDPFLGSGTTLIAAEMTHRKCLGLEIDPGYTDVICRRWQEFTGKEATLDAPGKPTHTRVETDRAKAPPKRKRAPRSIAAE